MSTNATARTPKINHPEEGQCPAWCAKHWTVDPDHRDESVSHNSATVRVAHHDLFANRTVLLRNGQTEDTLWLDGEQVTADQMRRLGASMVAYAALVDGPQS